MSLVTPVKTPAENMDKILYGKQDFTWFPKFKGKAQSATKRKVSFALWRKRLPRFDPARRNGLPCKDTDKTG